MDKTLAKIAENTPLALIILGAALLIVGAAGAVPFTQLTITEPGWRIAVAVAGGLSIAIGFLLLWSTKRKPESINPKKYKVEITSPRDGDLVDRTFEIWGRYGERLPDGYVIVVVELNASSRNYRPRKIAILENDRDWRAASVFSGEKSGEEKIVVVGLMGTAGQVLFDYWEKVGRNYQYKDRPSIDSFDRVFHECGRVKVRVR